MGLNRSPEQLIKAGLAALKQKDYERAIATFEHLRQADGIATGHRLKAQMGLVCAYDAQGAREQAQTLCKSLLKSQSHAIRQWAHDKLQQLASDAGPLSATPSVSTAASLSTSGFVPATSGFIPCSQTSLFHYQTLNSKQELSSQGNKGIAPAIENNRSTATPSAPSNVSLKKTDQPPIDRLDRQSVDRQSNPISDLVASSVEGPDTWPQGDRLTTLKSLGKVNHGRLWFAQLATTFILFWVVRWLVQISLMVMRNYISVLDRLLPLINIRLASFFWAPHTWTVIIGLGLLTFAAPWLWPLLLRPTRTVTTNDLQVHSPEAVQVLRHFCSKRRWTVPKIQLLTSDLPIIFSYGWRPRYGHLVISQGLLERLESDELAAIFMYEMSHWSHWDWVFFSTHGLLLQAAHRAYWWLALWGESRPFMLKATAGFLATLSYGIFWLLARVGYGLGRTRIPYRDRSAAELTGNPHGLVRALAKLSLAMGKAIETQGYTPPLLESLQLMLPVRPGQASSVQHFAWGAFNPLRHWLSINQAHPPLGDRLYVLGAYGRHWRLKPSLSFSQLRLKHGSRNLSGGDWQNLLLQGGVWSGLLLGLAVALGMWLIGALSASLDFTLLAWLYRDRSILISMPLIGAATVQLLRINSFFPDIATSLPINKGQLSIWQTDPTLIPISSLPIKINGSLTGRPTLANWLGQEWRLRTAYGSIPLHYASYLGTLSNPIELASLLHQPLQVTGWFRRGHSLWIDIARLRTHQNHIKLAHHPTWSLIISLLLLWAGLWLIFKGT